MPRREASSFRDGRFLAAAFLVALGVRLLPLAAAAEGGVRLLSPDCYGHLRRAASVARNFPRVPVVDPYLNHPDGAVWIWPPAFDLLIGGASRLAFGRDATTEQVTWVAASIPPVLGALHVIPLFFLARRAFGRRRALIAIWAYGVLPAAVLWSCFGHADQHAAEALALLLVLAAAARAASRRPGEPGAARAALLGAALAAAVLTWQGAVFVAVLLLPWCAFALGRSALWAGLVATLGVALATAMAVGTQEVPFTFISFGWFQPALLSLLTIPLACLGIRRATNRHRVGRLAVAAVLSAAVFPALPRLLPAAGQGVAYVLRQTTLPSGRDFAAGGYLSYPREWLNVIAESRPLLPDLSVPAFVSATRDLSAGLLLLPVALFLWARSGRHAIRASGSRPRARLLLVLFGAVTLVMALSQRRNVYYLGIFTALALAEAVGRLTTLFRKASWRAAAVPVGVLLALLLVAVPGLPTLIRLRDYADAPGHDMLDLMARLKALDPPGADPAALPLPAPGAIPGVMAPWSMGHFVTALAERPAAADPFAYGWRRQCRLFTASDDAEAWDILKTARCRYLVTTDLRPVLPFYASAAARPPASVDTMFSVRVHESALEKPLPFLTKVLDSRTAARTPDGRIVPRFRVFRVDGAP